MSTIKYSYLERPGGHMPILPVSMGRRDLRTEWFPFYVDTGAMLSFAPKESIEEIIPDIHELPESSSGCVDVHGQPILGSPAVVDLEINGLPKLSLEIWFSANARLFLLGETWLEKVEASFRNFHPDRHFVLRSPPPAPDELRERSNE